MLVKAQIDEVKELISFKQEGNYWGFKRDGKML